MWGLRVRKSSFLDREHTLGHDNWAPKLSWNPFTFVRSRRLRGEVPKSSDSLPKMGKNTFNFPVPVPVPVPVPSNGGCGPERCWRETTATRHFTSTRVYHTYLFLFFSYFLFWGRTFMSNSMLCEPFWWSCNVLPGEWDFFGNSHSVWSFFSEFLWASRIGLECTFSAEKVLIVKE